MILVSYLEKENVSPYELGPRCYPCFSEHASVNAVENTDGTIPRRQVEDDKVGYMLGKIIKWLKG